MPGAEKSHFFSPGEVKVLEKLTLRQVTDKIDSRKPGMAIAF